MGHSYTTLADERKGIFEEELVDNRGLINVIVLMSVFLTPLVSLILSHLISRYPRPSPISKQQALHFSTTYSNQSVSQAGSIHLSTLSLLFAFIIIPFISLRSNLFLLTASSSSGSFSFQFAHFRLNRKQPPKANVEVIRE